MSNLMIIIICTLIGAAIGGLYSYLKNKKKK